jgi:hypothetical protein
MTPDREQLISIIESHRDELITAICRKLQRLSDSHYAMIDYECHVEREEVFLDALLKGLRDPASHGFLDFVKQLSETRSEEGYSLEEFQEAFNIVEDCLWEKLVQDYERDDTFVEMLAIMIHIFRRAKDCLARIYLDKALLAERELEHLRRKFRAYRKASHAGHP